MIRLAIIAAAALALAGCSKTVVRDRPVQVNIPVAQPCIGTRRARPLTLEAKTSEWEAMDIRQRVAAIGAWALEWVNYGQDLEVAIAGCPKADSAPVVTAKSSH